MELASFNPRQSIVLPGDLTHLSRRYLSDAGLRGLSANTIAAYTIDLEQFVGFCHEVGITLAQHVTGRTLDDFTAGLLLGNGLKPQTVARKVESIRSLFNYIMKRDIPGMRRNPVEDATPIKFTRPKVIAPDEGPILDLIQNIPDDTVEGIRDRALYYLMYCSALRVGGIRSLQVYDPANPAQYTVTPGGVVRYLAKGGETKETVADETALELIAQWLEARKAWPKARNNPALFVSNRGAPVSKELVYTRLKQHGARVGVKHIHPHMLRHRRLGLLAETLGLKTAQDIAGHSDIRTTGNLYGGVTAERTRHRVLTEAPVGLAATKEKEAC